jgi:hypothetical protein
MAMSTFLPQDSCKGYTLIESLVSLGLLLTVLVPCGALLLTFAQPTGRVQQLHVLAVAESAMSESIAQRQFFDETEFVGQFRIDRAVQQRGRSATIILTVRHADKEEKILLRLSKTILLPPGGSA